VTLLDVRTVAEFEEGCIPNAINIPLDTLRERLDELDLKSRCMSIVTADCAAILPAVFSSRKGLTAAIFLAVIVL
jgi:rhodanese-related sulfurtransferase